MSVQVSGDKITFSDGSVLGSAWTGFKNRIINGAMMIDQRNAGASVTPTASTYTLDRWRLGNSMGGIMSVQQSADAPSGFNNSILCTVVTTTSPIASNLLYLQQNIEGYNVSDFGFGTSAAQTVTASFWVKSSVTGVMSFSIINGGLTRSYCTTYTINAANTWEYKTITISGDVSGTWLTTNGIGLEVHFNFAVGSDNEATANNQWEAGRKYATASTADFTTNIAGSTIQFTGVQLEKGSTATSFDYRPYTTELQLAQRYCFAQNTAAAGSPSAYYSFGIATQGSASQSFGTVTFPVTMRQAPSVTTSAASSFFCVDRGNYTSISIDQVSKDSGSVFLQGGSGGTTGAGGRFLQNNTTAAYLIWSAEL